MASEVHELLVRLRPEGAKETREELEATTEQFDASAEQTDEASGAMAEFAGKFKGAMQVVVAGLAVASAGLLSQVPVIGEAASGIFAIIDAIAFKMDKVLRPVIQPISVALFDIADAINRAEGPFGTFIGIVATVASLLGLAEGAVLALNAAFGLSLTGPIAAIVGVLGGPVTVIILVIIALIGLLAYAWTQNWGDIQGKTAAAVAAIQSIIQDLVAFVKPFWNAFLHDALKGDAYGALQAIGLFFAEVLNRIKDFFAPFAGDVLSVIFSLFNRWITFQQTKFAIIRTSFETLFDLVINMGKRFVNEFARTIERGVNAALNAIPADVRKELGIRSNVSVGTPFGGAKSNQEVLASGGRRLQSRLSDIRGDSSRRQSAADRQIERLVTAMQNTDIEFAVSLDSREVAEETKPFMDEGTAARGR